MTGSGKTRHLWQIKKNKFFMLIKSYNLSQLSAKILEVKHLTCTELAVELGCIQQISFQSVSEPVLSVSLATLLDVVVNFQPEVSCRLHAIVSKLCRFF